jgi:hypothetical protein
MFVFMLLDWLIEKPYNLHNASQRIYVDISLIYIVLIFNVVSGSTQPLREMSTRNLPGSKGRPALKADNLTAICEPIV